MLVPETGKSTMCTILEFEDEDEEAHLESYAPVHLTDIEIPHRDSIPQMDRARQANGLLFLDSPDVLYVYISNPLTRQYIKLCLRDEYKSDSDYVMSFGFCMSKISGQYGVICINGCVSDSYHVYTLGTGTGTWRRVETGPASGCRFNYIDHYTVCNGNPHWAVCDSAQTLWISVFDLETECFSIFPAPALEELVVDDKLPSDIKLDVLRDCLSLIYLINEKVIVIWMMKEYQAKESWTMEYQIGIDFDLEWIYLNISRCKVFKNGDVLIFLEDACLIYYSNKTKTTQQFGIPRNNLTYAMIYTPSHFSLKNFGGETVISF